MIIAANFKTNLTRSVVDKYIEHVENFASSLNQDILIFPAMTALDNFKNKKVVVGAQNAYPVHNGAFTGETGLDHLEEFGIKTILIGHSERRHILGEEQDLLVKKFDFFKAQGFKIVYCVGEPLEVRKEGSDATMKYITAQFEGIDTAYENLIVAYEPVWAIGTGHVPTLDEIEKIHTLLREKTSAPLLYGGSVKVNNVEEILNVKNVDGVLVGGDALYVEHFCSMINTAENIEKN